VTPVEVQIRPDPEERELILAAVEALLAADGRPDAYRNAWRERAIRENLDDDADES
jgi:hypothetical protein